MYYYLLSYVQIGNDACKFLLTNKIESLKLNSTYHEKTHEIMTN